MSFCRICGQKAKEGVCDRCNYFLSHGADEDTIKKMLSDDTAKQIWVENEKIAEELADAYYDGVLDNYKEEQIKRGSKEEFGYNTFLDGIKLGLDIVLPLLDTHGQEKVKEKIAAMITASEMRK